MYIIPIVIAAAAVAQANLARSRHLLQRDNAEYGPVEYAGYKFKTDDSEGSKFTTISATFNLPTLATTSSNPDHSLIDWIMFWVGISGNGAMIQAGVEIDMNRTNLYYFWYEWLPVARPDWLGYKDFDHDEFKGSPGDDITVTIKLQDTDTATVDFFNHRTGKYSPQVSPSAAVMDTATGASFQLETQADTIPNWGTLSVKDCTVQNKNGVTKVVGDSTDKSEVQLDGKDVSKTTSSGSSMEIQYIG